MWRLGVVGSPIQHSLTPTIHRAALAELGLDGESEAVEVTQDDAPGLTAALTIHDALSITMPLKEEVIGWCDELDDVARRVGGVNSVIRRNNRLHGRATDGVGFVDAVADELTMTLTGCRVAVRGSGGAAKSITDALVAEGATVLIVGRNQAALAQLKDRYSEVEINSADWGTIDLVVNTVPVDAVVDTEFDSATYRLGDRAAALDIVYDPAESPWLADRRREGFRTANGLAMLVHQARHQLQWWFDSPVSLDALFRAVGR